MQANMTATDQFILVELTGDPDLLGSTSPEEMARWWYSEREGDEGLAAFLTRRGVLIAQAERIIRTIIKGYVDAGRNNLRQVLEPNGRARLAQQLALFSVREPLDEPEAPFSTSRLERLEVIRPTAGLRAESPPSLGGNVAASASPGPEPEPGQVWGRCRLAEKVGVGGFGTVFRAEHLTLGTTVAVKFLHRGRLGPRGLEEFRAEARTLARLKHPNIVRVLDFADDECPFLVMEFVEGQDLARALRNAGTLSPTGPLPSLPRPPAAWRRAGGWGSSTATSSPPTYSWRTMARPNWPTWGWRSPWKRTVPWLARASRPSSAPSGTCLRSRPQATRSTTAPTSSPWG
jgi:hypothetical protein